jgi:thioredoxin-like negative regulator of GroEL
MKIRLTSKPAIKQITINDFDIVANSDKPFVIKLYSPSCHLCKALAPIYNDISEKYKDKFNFGTINVVSQKKLTDAFEIDGVPELFIVHNGKVHNIKYPEDDPDPKSGYSYEHIVQHLDNFER